MSHPARGLPPRDESAGSPAGAARLRAERATLGARGLEIALDRTPAMRERYDEYAMRRLLRDSETLVERIADVVATDDPTILAEFADQVAPVYRRRRVPMDDLVALMEGLRAATTRTLSGAEQASASRGIDAAIEQFRWYRRLAGDARKRNPVLAFLYKGG